MADQTAGTVVVNQNVDTDDTSALIESLPAVIEESKKGYKTTEFWLTIIASVLVVANGIPLPDKYEGFVVTALAAVYAISRGIAKQGIPAVTESPVSVAPVQGE